MAIERVVVLGVCATLALALSCGEKEQPTIGKHASHSHAHYHGGVLHTHPNTGAHSHEWLKDKTPYRPAPSAQPTKIPLDVSAIADRAEGFDKKRVTAQGIVTSLAVVGNRCRMELSPLTGRGATVLVEGEAGLCGSNTGQGKIVTVKGTFLRRQPDQPGGTDHRSLIRAEDVQTKPATDPYAHEHNGKIHSHPHNGPHSHDHTGEIATP